MTAQDWAARVKWPASEEIEEMLRQHAARAAQAGQDKAAAAGTAPRDAA